MVGVVVGVDAEMIARHGLRDLPDDGSDLVRERPAVGVAKHHPSRPAAVGGIGAGDGVRRVGLVAVEEVFAIDHHFAPGRDRRGDRLPDGLEIVLVGGAERHPHMEVPRLGDEADRRRPGPKHVLQSRVVGDRPADALHHAERSEVGIELAILGEERRVGRIGARISTLDVVEPELVQPFEDDELVFERVVDARRLLPVAQRRVEEIEPLLHRRTFQLVPSRPSFSSTPFRSKLVADAVAFGPVARRACFVARLDEVGDSGLVDRSGPVRPCEPCGIARETEKPQRSCKLLRLP